MWENCCTIELVCATFHHHIDISLCMGVVTEYKKCKVGPSLCICMHAGVSLTRCKTKITDTSGPGDCSFHLEISRRAKWNVPLGLSHTSMWWKACAKLRWGSEGDEVNSSPLTFRWLLTLLLICLCLGFVAALLRGESCSQEEVPSENCLSLPERELHSEESPFIHHSQPVLTQLWIWKDLHLHFRQWCYLCAFLSCFYCIFFTSLHEIPP